MDFIFELFAELILEPVLEGYILAMTHFSGDSKKVNKDKIKTVVCFESIALMIMFFVGGIMLLETKGESLIGKIIFILSIAVSVIQISSGIILKKMKKKIKINFYKKSTQKCYRNGGTLYFDTDKIVFKRFITLFEFNADEVFCRPLPGEGFWSAVELFDRKNSYVLLATKRKCEKINDYITSIK